MGDYQAQHKYAAGNADLGAVCNDDHLWQLSSGTWTEGPAGLWIYDGQWHKISFSLPPGALDLAVRGHEAWVLAYDPLGGGYAAYRLNGSVWDKYAMLQPPAAQQAGRDAPSCASFTADQQLFFGVLQYPSGLSVCVPEVAFRP